MQYYSLYQVAKLLNTSHTTIYNKLKDKDVYKVLKGFIKVNGKSKSMSKEGVEVLKQYINVSKSESKKTDPFINHEETLESDSESKIINMLKTQIESLEKDKERLYKQLEKEQELHYNTQILFKQEKEKVLLLEDGMQKKEERKSIWRRFFKN